MKNPETLPAALGLDLGGSSVKVARAPGGQPGLPALHETVEWISTDREPLLGTLAEIIRDFRAGEPPGEELRVGLALPGFLSADRRTVIRLSNLPALDGLDLAAELERRLDDGTAIRWTLDTDTTAGARAEALEGAGAGSDRVLYLSLGTGLGAALIHHGEPVRVVNHVVAQVAHIPLTSRRIGAEARLSARGLLERAGDPERYPALARLEVQSAGEIHRLGTGDSPEDTEARSALREHGQELGELAAILGNLFSPGVIVIGGGLSAAGDSLLAPARPELERGLREDLRGKIELRAALLGRGAGARGMAELARRDGPG